jgi:D-glycero-alpha-D-manno-heptose 1-phosphate guanylyltransferase
VEAIILAGGSGTRLKKVLPNIPKPMAPINGKPFLEFLLSNLAASGFNHIILSIGYKADYILDFFGSSFLGMKITYVIEKTPLGTGGAIRYAMESTNCDHVYVLNGDTYLDLNYGNLENFWKHSKDNLIVSRNVEDTTRYGSLLVKENRIIGFIEKGVYGRGVINAGIYILRKDIFNDSKQLEVFSFEQDWLIKNIKKKFFTCYSVNDYFIDIGIPEDYERAKLELPKITSKYTKVLK